MEKLDNLSKAKNELFKCFGVKEDYFIKSSYDFNWTIKKNNDLYFLNYWKDGEKVHKCIIVKKDGKPQIFSTAEATMIIVIECVKIAVVLNNLLRI